MVVKTYGTMGRPMSRFAARLDRLLHRLSNEGEMSDGVERVMQEELSRTVSLRDILGRHESDELERFFSELDALPRLRPVMVSLAAHAAGAGETESELQYTAELLHLALIVHDVALGRQGGRRRRLARKIMKRSIGMFGGHSFTLRALELARHTSSPEILGELVETLRDFSDGQHLSEGWRDGKSLANREEYFHHADSHTGALLSFCCRSGAHLAGGDLTTLTALGRYGRHVGRVWNMADDVVQLSSESAEDYLIQRATSGRPVLPASIAGERDVQVHSLWGEMVKTPSYSNASRVLEAIREQDGIRLGAEMLVKESWTARRALRHVPESEYRSALDSLVSGMARESVLVA